MSETPNEQLTLHNIPSPEAGWSCIGWFALTFNGYEHWESFEQCSAVANTVAADYKRTIELPHTLTELRTALFFEQRRWRHSGYDPNEDSMHYIKALVAQIRARVADSQRD